MTTVLLAWEMGGGQGHAHRLLAIARALADQGLRPVVAARRPELLASAYAEAGITVLAAPDHASLFPSGRPYVLTSYADMMAMAGYACADTLAAILAAWDDMLEQVRPALVVADFSPFLTLAAYGRVPVLAIGDGFVLPPGEGERFPVIQDLEPMAPFDLLTENVRIVQLRRGAPCPPSLPRLIAGDESVICTLPELDVYAAHRVRSADGALLPLPTPAAPPGMPRIFAYLSAESKTTRMLLQAILDLGLPATIHLAAASPDLLAILERRGMTVHRAPPPLAETLAGARLFLHHGGIGSIETAVALGRAQVLAPRYFEQKWNAATLMRLGAALAFDYALTMEQARTGLARAMADLETPQRAARLAAHVAGRPPALPAITAAVARLLG
ncbi:MAG: hypothetical protein K2Q10_12800 [Rhodospirillales bacterium]|nr:hypothetical protein [Rhodospirillales bacterium]